MTSYMPCFFKTLTQKKLPNKVTRTGITIDERANISFIVKRTGPLSWNIV